MSQCWYRFKGWLTTPWVSGTDGFLLPGDAAAAALDSHLLIDPHHPSYLLIASRVREDFDELNAVPAPNGYDRSLGTYLATSATSNMAFAIPVSFQQLVQPFAQIVIPDGEKVSLIGTAVGFNGQGLLLDVDIPEPSFALLAAVGLPCLLRRSRRRRRTHPRPGGRGRK